MEELLQYMPNLKWSDLITLAIGALLGALISVLYSIRSNRPRLMIDGDGGSSTQVAACWRISIANYPSFFGQRLNGETAYDVVAWLHEVQPRSQTYVAQWAGQTDRSTTIEPGLRQDIELFHWDQGDSSYHIKNQAGEPIARFSDRELQFGLRLNDRLGRHTEVRFKVDFDASHLKQTPRLLITYPKTMGGRWTSIRRGCKEIISAFKNY